MVSKSKNILYFSVVAIFLFLSFYFSFQEVPSYVADENNTLEENIYFTFIRLPGASFKVEVVQDQLSRNKGLSRRESLPEGEGMLFVFDRPAMYPFWMKDMNFSIDIIWMDSEKQVVHMEREVSPESFPNSFAPQEPSLYVLEFNSGFIDQYNISLGDQIDFEI